MERKKIFVFKIINQKAGIIIQTRDQIFSKSRNIQFYEKDEIKTFELYKEAAKNGWKLLLIWNFWNRN